MEKLPAGLTPRHKRLAVGQKINPKTTMKNGGSAPKAMPKRGGKRGC